MLTEVLCSWGAYFSDSDFQGQMETPGGSFCPLAELAPHPSPPHKVCARAELPPGSPLRRAFVLPSVLVQGQHVPSSGHRGGAGQFSQDMGKRSCLCLGSLGAPAPGKCE